MDGEEDHHPRMRPNQEPMNYENHFTALGPCVSLFGFGVRRDFIVASCYSHRILNIDQYPSRHAIHAHSFLPGPNQTSNQVLPFTYNLTARSLEYMMKFMSNLRSSSTPSRYHFLFITLLKHVSLKPLSTVIISKPSSHSSVVYLAKSRYPTLKADLLVRTEERVSWLPLRPIY